MKKFYNTWRNNAKELIYLRHFRIHKIGKMFMFKRKQIFIAWRKKVCEIKSTKLMIIKADKHRASKLLRSFQVACLKLKKERIAQEDQK